MSKVWESSELISAFQTREPRELHGSKFAGSSHFSCWQVSTGKAKWPWEEARKESRSAYVIVEMYTTLQIFMSSEQPAASKQACRSLVMFTVAMLAQAKTGLP